ncbi:glycoside hydrolase [Emericellopsis cladophorae]|uniref:Glycoside hydrolase n=1 Tax=Emericellopsis cladophorae TaxID=2686198 RepID=A0A9P9Y5D9_9HYPO|nr:glycoside hydrolase [Emericellopsis cladophorae]KAI6783558.1 glycoside hydrolase [Emericellopsis cladophorae]
MAARQVFAHYMVGLTDGQSQDQWTSDICAAKNLGIDSFAVNMTGPTDTWTLPQLRNAYRAAEPIGGFTLFPSFDMPCCGDWGVQAVIDIINEFKVSSAHTVAGDKPMVSTFGGPACAMYISAYQMYFDSSKDHPKRPTPCQTADPVEP